MVMKIKNFTAVAGVESATLSWEVDEPANLSGFSIVSSPTIGPEISIQLPASARTVLVPNLTPTIVGYLFTLTPTLEQPASASTKTVPTAKAKIIVGLNGLAGWGPAQQKIVETITHTKHDRLNIGNGHDLSWLREVCATGCVPLVIYDPGLSGRPITQIATDLIAISKVMKELKLTQIEFGNEVYFHGTKPPEYAMQYRTAHETLSGSGIELIANGYGDYERYKGSWSQVEGGKGWCVDFAAALGFTPDGWSFHPYGRMTAPGFEGSGASGGNGWMAVPRIIANLKEHAVYAPVHITEVGQSTNNDPGKEVSLAAQAEAVKQYISDASRWGCASIYIFCMDDPYGKPGFGLWTSPKSGQIGPAKPAAAAFGEAVKAIGV